MSLRQHSLGAGSSYSVAPCGARGRQTIRSGLDARCHLAAVPKGIQWARAFWSAGVLPVPFVRGHLRQCFRPNADVTKSEYRVVC